MPTKITDSTAYWFPIRFNILTASQQLASMRHHIGTLIVNGASL